MPVKEIFMGFIEGGQMPLQKVFTFAYISANMNLRYDQLFLKQKSFELGQDTYTRIARIPYVGAADFLKPTVLHAAIRFYTNYGFLCEVLRVRGYAA